MNIIYPMIIFIFVVGAGITYVNEVQLYPVLLPDSGISAQASDAQTTAMALQETSKNPAFSIVEQAFILGKCAIGGLTAIFTLGFLLNDMGVPLGLVGWLISPLGIVVVFWFLELWLGRQVE